MSVRVFSPARVEEQPEAFATLVSAFMEDPVERWLFPDTDHYLTQFPHFLAAFGGRAFEEQTVWKIGEMAGVALWLPPGAEPDGDAIVAVLSEHVASDQHADMFSVLEQMDAAHPRYPHWYLPWFGVQSPLQGQGLGGQLMSGCLAIVDESHLPAYLETPNPRTVAFYERHGFNVTGEARAGACPAVTCMRRDGR
jgi:GNAT superfamily N-acetyltransferase